MSSPTTDHLAFEAGEDWPDVVCADYARALEGALRDAIWAIDCGTRQDMAEAARDGWQVLRSYEKEAVK